MFRSATLGPHAGRASGEWLLPADNVASCDRSHAHDQGVGRELPRKGGGGPRHPEADHRRALPDAPRGAVLPSLGATKADDLRVQHIRTLIDRSRRRPQRLVDQGNDSPRSRPRSSTASAISGCRRGTSSAIWAWRASQRHASQTEPRYLSVAEVEKLLAVISDPSRDRSPPPASGVALRISRGARAHSGEHIDFDAESISVARRGRRRTPRRPRYPLLPALARELPALTASGRCLTAASSSDRSRRRSSSRRRPASRVPSAERLPGGERLPAVQARSSLPRGRSRSAVHDLRHSLAANAFALGSRLPRSLGCCATRTLE